MLGSLPGFDSTQVIHTHPQKCSQQPVVAMPFGSCVGHVAGVCLLMVTCCVHDPGAQGLQSSNVRIHTVGIDITVQGSSHVQQCLTDGVVERTGVNSSCRLYMACCSAWVICFIVQLRPNHKGLVVFGHVLYTQLDLYLGVGGWCAAQRV